MMKKEVNRKIKYGGVVSTKFVDHRDCVKVSMINWPDQKRIKRVLCDFVEASWEPNHSKKMSEKERDKTIRSLIKGNALPLGLETMKFVFLIENVSLHITHSIVRHRIGCVFSQMSQATTDLRNADIIMPRSFSKVEGLDEAYRAWCATGKQLYADALDSGEVGTQDARMFLPKGVCNYIYMSADLLALQNFIGKRLCDQEEPIELNIIAEQMRKQIVSKFPYLKEYLVSNCSKGKCLHQRTGSHANVIYKRNKSHFVKNSGDKTLFDKTRDDLIGGKR